MALNKQYCVYGVDTSAFYFEEEKRLETKIYNAKQYRNRLKNSLADASMDKCVRFSIEENYKKISNEMNANSLRRLGYPCSTAN